MKTNELIDVLATSAGPVAAHAVSKRFAAAVVAGGAAAFALMVASLGLNPHLDTLATLPAWWAKVAFAAVIAVGGVLAAARLARPDGRMASAAWLVAAPALVMWLLGFVTLAGAQPGERVPLVLGSTWRECPFNIALLSVPLFVASLWALRGLAPTRPRLAGAAAGLLAGALAALVYALHCPEVAFPFLAVWYLLGMLIPAALGACIGPSLLRW